MGILGSAYRALDRFLPFDQQLDPMFGNGILSQSNAGAQVTPGYGPQGQMQAPQGGVMGFPAMPGPQGQQQAPQAPEKPFKPSLVDTIWGVAAGYSPNQARQMQVDAYAKRQAQEAEAAQARDMRARQMAFADTLGARERAVFLADDDAWAKAAANAYKPEVVANESSIFVNGAFQRPDPVDYTLKPGEIRMGGPNNQQVASAPFAPQVVTTSPGQTATMVRPGAAGNPGGARSPQVGQMIYDQLATIPGLRLGSPKPRSEAEIAALPLSAKDTYHRQGAALDFTAPGQDPEAVVATVKAQMGPGYDVIYHPENGSFHVEPGPQWSAPGETTSQVVAQGGATGFRPATPDDRQRWGIPDGVPVKINVLTGEPEAIGGMAGALPKPPPTQVVSGYGANKSAIEKIDRALSLLSSAPQATGLIRGFGDTANQRFDPGGVEARQAVTDIAGQIMSDRSGAAVPVAEMARLAPYLPAVTDTPDTVRKKLAGLKRELASIQAQMEYDFPGLGQPGAGQRGSGAPAPAAAAPVPRTRPTPAPAPVQARKAPSPPAAKGPPVRVKSVQEAMALAPGTEFITPDGRRKVR